MRIKGFGLNVWVPVSVRHLRRVGLWLAGVVVCAVVLYLLRGEFSFWAFLPFALLMFPVYVWWMPSSMLPFEDAEEEERP